MNDICYRCGCDPRTKKKKNKVAKPTEKVIEAMLHVQSHYPDVTYVIYGVDSRWQYMDDEFYAPKFKDKDQMNISLLEEAVDSLPDLPAVFYLPKIA